MTVVLKRKCSLKDAHSCRMCKKENDEYYCGLSPSERIKKEAGFIIGGFLNKETSDAINQYHNPWCKHYYTE